MFTRAWASLLGETTRTHRRAPVIVRKDHAFGTSHDVAIGVHTDAVFGPVLTVGVGGACATGAGERLVLLPPLNERLARDLVRGSPAVAAIEGNGGDAASMDALARVLVQVSTLVCALPWVRSLRLDPVRVGEGRAEITGAHVTTDPDYKRTGRRYGHMAIHPYPVDMVTDVTLRDGTPLHVRPIRPEDAEMEREFVARPVGADALLPLLLPAARAHARACSRDSRRWTTTGSSRWWRSANRTASRRSSASLATS